MIISRVSVGQNSELTPSLIGAEEWDQLAEFAKKIYDDRLHLQYRGHPKAWVNRLTYYSWIVPWLAPIFRPVLEKQWKSQVTEANDIGRQLGHFQSICNKISPEVRDQIVIAPY